MSVRVRRCDSKKFWGCDSYPACKGTINIQKSYKTAVSDDGVRRAEHILIYEKEHGLIPKKHEVHHIDGNEHNNEIENLAALPQRVHRKIHRESKKRKTRLEAIYAEHKAMEEVGKTRGNNLVLVDEEKMKKYMKTFKVK